MGIWSASISLRDSLGWRYLVERRGLHVGLLDDLSHVLRWHQGISAVVALMTDPVNNEPTGVHRTYINPDGTKRERKMLGRRGVIRLSPDEEVTRCLGLCEGIEDGLAILLSGWAPVWAATSAGAIQQFPVLSGIDSLTVFIDDDEAGINAAQSCAANWTAAGREARIAHPRDSYGT
jgi:putative DNA primase/helicase